MELNNSEDVRDLLTSVLNTLLDYGFFDPETDQPVVRFMQPEELQKELPVTLGEQPTAFKDIKTIIRQIVQYSVRTNSPHFHNQLYAGMDNYGLAGAWLTEALNTSQYTYEVAPVFTVLEREVINRSLQLIGYPSYPEADGLFSPGGSLSNMYGLVLARFARFPEIKTKGASNLPCLAIFTSEDGHYSMTKGAHWLGIGTDNIYTIKTDELGRMCVRDLEEKIVEARAKGCLPYFVNATAGTTVLGAIDPLDEIADVCEKAQLWLHVDACLGGSLLLSEKYRDRLKGIQRSNSVSWNPHKMLGAPFQCSLFLVKGENLLHEANSAHAKYLFQQDKFYDVSWDTGDKSIQCGRKADAMKFWLMWKARGSIGMAESVDKAMDAAEYFYQTIRDRPGYNLVIPKFEGSNICFWYVPQWLREMDKNSDLWKQHLHGIAPAIKKRMILDGSLMVGYTPMPQKDRVNFFRMVVNCKPAPSRAHMDYVIRQIEHYGEQLIQGPGPSI